MIPLQSIKTKYLGPTDKLGSRIKATASGGHSLTISIASVSYQRIKNAHKEAARQLAAKLDWTGPYHIGHGDANGYVFVNSTEAAFTI